MQQGTIQGHSFPNSPPTMPPRMDEHESKFGPHKPSSPPPPQPPPSPPSPPRKKLRGPSRRPCKHDHAERLLHEHRSRLTHLFRRFVDDHNWKDAALAFSVLDKLWPRGGHGWTTMDLRKNFFAAIHIVLRNEGGTVNIMRVQQLCDIWTSRLKWTKMCIKERHLVQLELALFFLIHRKTREALQITKFLIHENEIADDLKLHFVHGMASFHAWYSRLPDEMQLNGGVHMPQEFEESLKDSFDQINVDNTSHHSSSRKVELNESTNYNSISSIDNYRRVKMEFNHPQRTSQQDIFSDGLPTNGPLKFEEADRLSNLDFRFPSIFSCHGLDGRLLPMKLKNLPGSIEQKIHSHGERLDENYLDAVSHLHDALFSEPPLFAALIPYVQILLLGDQVEEALRELKKFCQLTNSAIPFRLRADLLEVFGKNQLIEICNCHETALKRDPTCSSSLERLISIFKDGNYGLANLLEMIALHLDAAAGNCNIWEEFTLCLLSIQTSRISEFDQDQISTNAASHQSTEIPINFLRKGKRAWELRSRWWSKHHFSKGRYDMEMQAGDWRILTCKAAAASHLYGPEIDYVKAVQGSLSKNHDDVNLSFLHQHMKSALKLYEILSSTLY